MRYRGSPAEVLAAFLFLGLTSFGGPFAHLAYFRRTFVDRKDWLSESDYAAIVSMCQCLPGPASSQTGFCIGLARAGWAGGIAAWIGFTLPSAALMFEAANWLPWLIARPWAAAALHGLQIAAVAVVGQAVVAMTRNLCPDLPRRMLAVLAAAILILVPDIGGQVLVLLISAFIGYFLPLYDARAPALGEVRFVPGYAALVCLALFFFLLALSNLDFADGDQTLFAAFYRTGALVFGGGHVVLPLLQSTVVKPGWVAPRVFLAGYGAAAALPGPLFSFAAFLGAVADIGPGGPAGAGLALAAIFLPGLLLAGGLLPYWNHLRFYPLVAGSVAGVNAAVVGVLAFALIGLVTHSDIRSLPDVAITILAFLSLSTRYVPPVLVVAGCVVAVVIT